MTEPAVTQRTLWREYLALAISDMTMALGDPLANTTTSHLPDARPNLAAFGVGITLAVVIESPVIMILHAANALAPSVAARRALWRLVLTACSVLTLLMLVTVLPPVFDAVVVPAMSLPPEVAFRTRWVVAILALWPAAIGWRRYFQGLLIHGGHMRAVAVGGLGRLAVLAGMLGAGYWARWPGAVAAATAMIAAVLAEALIISLAAWRYRVRDLPDTDPQMNLPRDLGSVWRFYWPLASAMLVVWGGRALVVACVARSVDAALSLAAWPVAMCIVVLVANATRMVQQVVIRYRNKVPTAMLRRFTLSVGMAGTALLGLVTVTPWGHWAIASFVGHDAGLLARIGPVLLICAGGPLLVASQSALQGMLIGAGNSGAVYRITWIGVVVQVVVCWLLVTWGVSGAQAASVGLLADFLVEVACLAGQVRRLEGPEPVTAGSAPV